MKELEIVKNEIDWFKIIKITLNRKDWGKSYVLYNYEDVTISIIMKTFDFERNVAEFKIKCNYPKDEYYNYWHSYNSIDIYMDNYSIDNINMLINRRTKTLLNNLIADRLKRKAEEEYRHLKYYITNIDADLIESYEMLEDYKEVEKISNVDVREKALDELNDILLFEANKMYNNKIDTYIENNKDNKGMYKILEMLENE